MLGLELEIEDRVQLSVSMVSQDVLLVTIDQLSNTGVYGIKFRSCSPTVWVYIVTNPRDEIERTKRLRLRLVRSTDSETPKSLLETENCAVLVFYFVYIFRGEC